MESLIFALILITTTFAPAASENLYASENPVPVGGNVTLYSQADVHAAVWMFNSEIIVLMLDGKALISNMWINRAILNSNSSLTINSLQLNDSGDYIIHVVNFHRASLTLTVQMPISNVTTWANATDLVEFNDAVVLNCSALIGTHMSYAWLMNGCEITADERMQLSNGGATLTIVGVTRYDQGLSCNVSNGVSHESSHPLYLNISYGPSNPSMSIMPMRLNHVVGDNITLSCSAESSPPASIHWMLDGVYLDQTGPQLQLEMVSESQSGDYQCIFYNSVTSRSSNQSSLIRILDPRKHIQVEPSMNPANEGDAYELTCNITAPATHVHWLKNGEPLHDNTTVFDMDNKTVTFCPLERNHAGTYECMATTALWILTSHPYELVVNYGPEALMVDGPAFAQVGENATFHCSAVSVPPSEFSWWLNGVQVGDSAVFTTHISSTSMSGNITCMAYNLMTGRNDTKFMMLTVTEPIESVMIRNNIVPILTSENFTLTCDVIGTYDKIAWMKDNMQLNMTLSYHIENNTLHFPALAINLEGTYQCVATNRFGNHTSPGYHLMVIWAIQSVMIKNSGYPIHSKEFILTCEVNGPYDTIHWMKNNVKLYSGNPHMENNTLHFTPLNRDHEGTYKCVASNKAGPHDSNEYNLLAIYGPLNVIISTTSVGPIVSLTCSADSRPQCDFNWLFNGQPSQYPQIGSAITFPAITTSYGNYTCQATNPVTKMAMSQTKVYSAAAFGFPSQAVVTMMGLFALAVPVMFV